MNNTHVLMMNDEQRSYTRSPLDSRQLRAFATLARTASFTAAGRELFLSQSAISHSMRALEEDVGCRLFDRVGKKVSLTLAGEQLLQHAEKILTEMSLARESIGRLGKWGRGRLRVAASTTACTYILPTVLREFKESFEHYAITIVPADTAQMLDQLHAGRVDLALTLEPKPEEKLVFEPLFEDELVFVMSPHHPWAEARSVERRDVPRQNYILYHRNSYTFRLVDDYFRRERLVLNTFIELGSMEAIKELVKLNLGISVLAPWIVREELQAGTLVALPVGKRKLRRQWGIIRWKARPLNLAEETFVGLCREVTGHMLEDTDRWSQFQEVEEKASAAPE
ncbi:MAG: LysR family transcriptional regulator [Verrucomicrobiales bacterium]|nr:LysR family transcriptional regulator [Verrucomicrobiales bacterium]